jgi:hypothetical protein
VATKILLCDAMQASCGAEVKLVGEGSAGEETQRRQGVPNAALSERSVDNEVWNL